MSFAQVFTCKLPFFEIKDDFAAFYTVLTGKRPSKPVNCESIGFSDELWDVMQRGWGPEPNSRPPLGAFIEVLEA
jgi:hypothetical protein